MNGDLVNAAFEVAGGLLTWMNVVRIVKDRGYAGIYPPAVVLFTSWGLWNLWYYPSLGQWASLAGGLVVFSGNIAWLTAMAWYGRKGWE